PGLLTGGRRAGRKSLRASRRNDADRLTGNQRVGRIDDDVFLTGQAGNDFYLGAKIAAGRDGQEHHVIVAIHLGGLQTLRLKDQRVDRQDERGSSFGNLQVNFGIGTWEKLAAGVVDIHLDEQRARGQINRVGGANERPLETAAGKFGERQISGQTRLGRAGIDLGNIDVNTKALNGGNVKELF